MGGIMHGKKNAKDEGAKRNTKKKNAYRKIGHKVKGLLLAML